MAEAQRAKRQAFIDNGGIILNPDALEDMYEALKAVLDSKACNDDMSIAYAIGGLTRCQIDNALSKAEDIA